MRTRALFRAVVALALASAAEPSAAGQEGTCFQHWSDAAPVAKREGLMAVERLSQLARALLSGDLLKTTLCEEEGRFVYRLVIRHAQGPVRVVVVDAKRPFGR
jgi:uncharacterized membrane protein YkoI